MSQPDQSPPLPRRLLFATDLTPRCDRALERSLQLVSQWGAELLVVHCPEDAGDEREYQIEDFGDLPLWCERPSIKELAERRVRRDLAAYCREGGRIIVANGDPAEVIRWAAEDHGCDMIVTGAARAETFWNSILGTTTNNLLSKLRLPILVVRERCRGPYGNIVVAIDFSECSRSALTTTRRLFPDRPVVFHAYQTPYEQLLSDPDSYVEDARVAAEAKTAAFLADIGMETDIGGNVVEHGAPASLLRRYVRAHDVELVVMGHGGGNALGNIFLGSTARRILDAVGCDCLIVGSPDDEEGC